MRTEGADSRTAGFSLLEAMAALALTATIIMALGSVAGQWLPNWGRGLVQLQDADLLGSGVERIAADLSSAEFVTQSGGKAAPLFQGDASSVILVRSAIEPNTYPHLEYVRLGEANDASGFTMVRTRAPFLPGRPAPPVVFKDPVVLVRAPFRISFSYAGPDNRVWLEEWREKERLPDAVRITVRDGTGRVLAMSTAVRIRVTPPSEGVVKAKANANAAADEKPAAATSVAGQKQTTIGTVE